MKGSMKKKTTFFRIFTPFLCIGILGALLFGLFTYINLRNLLMENLIIQTKENLHQISSTIENQFQSLDSIAFSHATDSWLSQVVMEPLHTTDFITYREIISRLNFIGAFGPAMTNVDLISFEGQWMIQNNTLRQLSEELAADLFSVYGTASFSRIDGYDGEILIVRPIPLNLTTPGGALLISVPTQSISQLIGSGGKPTRSLFIVNSNGNLIYQNDPHINDYIDQINFSKLNGSSGVIEDSLVFARSLNYGFHYFTDLDWDSYSSTLQSTLIGAAFIVLIFLFIMFFTGYLVSSHFQTVMTNQMEQLKTLFIINLFYGVIEEDEAKAKVNQFSYPGKWDSLSVCAVQIDSSLKKENTETFLFSINEMIKAMISSKSCLSPIVIDTKTQATILLHQDKASAHQEIATFFKRIQKEVQDTLDITISVGISSLYYELSKTKAALKQSKASLNHRLIKGPEQIIFYDQIVEVKETNQHFYYPVKLSNALFESLKNGQIEEGIYTLNVLFAEIYINNKELGSFQLSIFRLLNDLLNLMSFLKINFSTKIRGDVYTIVSEFQTYEEVEFFIKEEIVNVIIETINDRKNNKYVSLAEEILDIIQKEFDTVLTLEGIAERIHYNPNYLSGIFKKSFNQSFSEYLAQYRHEMAKKWLLESKMTIKEISAKLQYNNSQNFIRSFRKIEDTTPGKYREEHN